MKGKAKRRPIFKQSRRLNFSILETGKEFAKKQPLKKKRRITEYGSQLIEKQKMAKTYNIREKQFRRLFTKAKKKSKSINTQNLSTGLSLFRTMEQRLDNLVFRSNFATTRKEARQMVVHKHILVNGKTVNKPSYLCKINDIISFNEKSSLKDIVKKRIQNINTFFPTVKVDKDNVSSQFIKEPERNELSKNINENLIVEWYNRK